MSDTLLMTHDQDKLVINGWMIIKVAQMDHQRSLSHDVFDQGSIPYVIANQWGRTSFWKLNTYTFLFIYSLIFNLLPGINEVALKQKTNKQTNKYIYINKRENKNTSHKLKKDYFQVSNYVKQIKLPSIILQPHLTPLEKFKRKK